MKEKIMNGLMLLIVGLSLAITLSREQPESMAVSALLPLQQAEEIHPLEAYRLERSDARKRETEALKELAALGDHQAEEMLHAIIRREEMEWAAEGVLAGQGYENAICVAQEENLTIFISHALSKEEAERLFLLMEAALGLEKENIHLSPC